ncbi:GAP1-N1 domain-containing protein [Vibrio splendidus]|uniref:GAP1-N1 domain-containing protein n=1 Tax=Vibrio splendidus TaxID=29497 RepID=UPI000D332824|nr:hypothetical protein [Vibrio splendidus]PTO78792.1 hypothetical protein CWN84_05960 [Vibrio splendidus]
MNNIIHQTFHGYNNGHKLLSSSVELSTQTKSILLRESDSPGEDFHHQNKPCYSGYPIAESGFYIISRTWVAKEISRPGCVWTHSLLIPFTLLSKYEYSNNIDLESIFLSKEKIEDYQNLLPINLEPSLKKCNKDLSLMFSQVFKTDSQVILNSDNHSLSDIISIWGKLWPRLRREFTFKTWSPKKIRSSSSFEKYNLVISDYSPLENTTDNWAKEYFSPNSSIHKFNWKYGASLNSNKGGVYDLYKAWLLYSNNKNDELIDYLLRWNNSPVPLVKDVIKNTSKNNLTLPLAYLISKYILTLNENDISVETVVMTGEIISKNNNNFFRKVLESEFFYKKHFYSEGIKNLKGYEIAELINNNCIQLDYLEDDVILNDDSFWDSLSSRNNLDLIGSYKSYNDIPPNVLSSVFNNFDTLELDEDFYIYTLMANFNVDRNSHREKIIKGKTKILEIINNGFNRYSESLSDFIVNNYSASDLSKLSDNSLCKLYIESSESNENIIKLISVLCIDDKTPREEGLEIILDKSLKQLGSYHFKYLEMSKIRSLLNDYLEVNIYTPTSLVDLLISFSKMYISKNNLQSSGILKKHIEKIKSKEEKNKENKNKYKLFWFLDL